MFQEFVVNGWSTSKVTHAIIRDEEGDLHIAWGNHGVEYIDSTE